MSRAKVMLNSEDIKPTALTIVNSCLAGGMSDSRKLRNLLERFGITLRAFRAWQYLTNIAKLL